MTLFSDDFGICPLCGAQGCFEPVEEAMQGTEPGHWEVVLFTCLACEGLV